MFWPRRRIFCLLGLVCAALLAGCSRAEQKPEEFRIGMIAPISGPVRVTGQLLAQARVAELNAAGGVLIGGSKRKVRLIVVDSGGQIEQAMSAMSRLIEQEHVSAIIGPYYSRTAIPVAAALDSLHVPMLSPSATSSEVTRGRRFAFRVGQVDSDQGRTLARYAYEDLGLRRAAMLYDEADAYSSGLAKYFAADFTNRPGATLAVEPYASGVTDFSAQLARLRASGAQVLFLPNYPEDLSRQLPQARAAGFTGLFLGGDSWDSDHGFHSLPEAQGAVYSTDFSIAAADKKMLEHAQALAARSGAELTNHSAMTLDALELLLAAAEVVGSTDPVSLRSGLANLTNFEGLSGRISFRGGGDPERSVCIMGISGGAQVLRACVPPVRK